MRLQDLAAYAQVPLDADKVLLEKFKAHDRVVHDQKTDLYSYRVRFTSSLSVPLCVKLDDALAV